MKTFVDSYPSESDLPKGKMPDYTSTDSKMLEKVKQRLKKCKLELNQEKSKIVYCRNNQKRQPPNDHEV